jgi:peptidoglycan L-alanyl-D-glutamate endopeptidase CwlK
MASRSLDHLRPDIKERAKCHIEACKAEGIDLLIYCTHRSNAEQDIEYAKGRTVPGNIVTNARGGHSPHNNTVNGEPASKAYDCVPLINGKAQWSNTALINRVGVLGEGFGLVWAGRWSGKLRESVHFEVK